MKKFDVFKTIQLILFIILTAVCLYIVFTDKELYATIANNPHVRALCILLWVVLVVTFLFIFMDFSLFSTFKKDYRELDFAVSSDPVAGIANRQSCDVIIEKYLDKPLPRNMGCIIFDLTNLGEVNKEHGHVKGNELIYEFSSILQAASARSCFVGRNGGNKFLALFEAGDGMKMSTFLSRVRKKVEQHNTEEGTLPIQYEYGSAYREGEKVQSITELIALANRRVYADKFTDE